MKSRVFISGSVSNVCTVASRRVFLTCVAAAVIAVATFSTAQTTVEPTAKDTKAAQKADAIKPAAAPAASSNVAKQLPSPIAKSPSRAALKQQAEYGVGSRDEASDDTGAGEDPSAAAAEDYQNRAYPAPYIPQQLTINAQRERGNNLDAQTWWAASPLHSRGLSVPIPDDRV